MALVLPVSAQAAGMGTLADGSGGGGGGGGYVGGGGGEAIVAAVAGGGGGGSSFGPSGATDAIAIDLPS